jgi:hypothetical protein
MCSVCCGHLSVPAEGTFKYNGKVLKGLYWDHHLTVTNCSQLFSESLQVFAAVIAQMAHQAFARLPLHLIQEEAAYVHQQIRD